MFERMRSTVGRLWCLVMHDAPMWPMHGIYQCRDCGRRYAAFAEAPVARQGCPMATAPLALERHGVV